MKHAKKLISHRSTILLRLAVLAIGLIALTWCGFILPDLPEGWNAEYPDYQNWGYVLTLIIAVSVVPFCIGLWQAWRLIGFIERNKSFSVLSVRALAVIKMCCLAIGLLFTLSMPLIFIVAQKEDAPGLILIFGAIFIGIPVTLAVFASVCQKLFQNAIDLKAENDLTV